MEQVSRYIQEQQRLRSLKFKRRARTAVGFTIKFILVPVLFVGLMALFLYLESL